MSRFISIIVSILISLYVTGIRAPVTIRREGVVVNYLYGKLKGVLVEFPLLQNQYESTPVEAFYGLEYSSVRKGEFRFMPPGIPLDKWDNHTKTGDIFRPPCPQNVLNRTALQTILPDGFVIRYNRISHYIKVTTEECLTLNLFRPTRPRKYNVF
ncbi:hypothetical protein FSP39_004262 [Pinctada imbricata]|uniref:Carboxylesterase type B domain-containing protein n=1 Tax=Pinctada imbricata TaxID=66713 RepID=A0AA88XZ53_PINIB|nr:hypothetical protein FSP39_004262 [Pinctada imbricata]